jgi:hypothetical protein
MGAIKDALVAAVKAYADAAGDGDFEAAWGSTGRKIQVRNETVDTGQGWSVIPGMFEAVFRAIESVLGSWYTDNYDLVIQSGATLSKEPINTSSIMVFHAGTLLRRVSSPSNATEYSISSRTLTFGAALTGWVSAVYLAKS